MAKKVIVFLAEGFEEIEAVSIIDVLRRAGLEVKTFALRGRDVTGSHGITISADAEMRSLPGDSDAEKAASLLKAESPDAVVLPGGQPGSDTLKAHGVVLETLKQAAQAGKVTAAICAAPIALGAAGLLSGKSFTCYPGYEKGLDGNKAETRVAVDGRIITANGPGSAIEFALALVSTLVSAEKSETLASAMQVR